MMNRTGCLSWLGLVMLVAIAPGCGEARDPNADVLSIGAYSVVHEVFRDGLMPAFKAEWQKKTGRSIVVNESYNGSGAQARAIARGLDADVAILSHEGDMESWSRPAASSPAWRDGPYKGMVTHSLVVIGHRPGNPKGIKDWSDLARRGSACSIPIPRRRAGRAGTSTRFMDRLTWLLGRRTGGRPTSTRWARSWRGSRRTWSTWTVGPPEHGQFRRARYRRRGGDLRE